MTVLIYICRIILSIILGFLVGGERSHASKPVGMRDVALVTMGSALVTIIGFELAKMSDIDMARLPYAVIMGVGFLGSGVIMHHKSKLEGITTASVLWVMVPVGILCGAGIYWLAIFSGICAYGILKLKAWKRWEIT